MIRPPAGFRVRPVRLDDAEAAARVINACTIAEMGNPSTTADSMRTDLTSPGRGPDDDAIVETEDGEAVGILQIWADVEPYDEIGAFVWVVPELWGRGISAFLLRLAEERGRAKLTQSPPHLRVVLQAFRYAVNDRAGVLFRAEGFLPARVFLDMRIDLREEPRAPSAVPGIELRTFLRGRDERTVHATLSEAFEDHWGYDLPPFEQFVHHQIDGEGVRFDPSLWWVATAGDDVVGASLCQASDRDPHVATVRELGVRRAWRGRGIGMALLLASFEGLRHAGFEGAELNVDAESPTGATRLYERAGMQVVRKWEVWEKELRPASGVTRPALA